MKDTRGRLRGNRGRLHVLGGMLLLSHCAGAGRLPRSPVATYASLCYTPPYSPDVVKSVDWDAVLRGAIRDPEMLLRAAEFQSRSCIGERTIEMARHVFWSNPSTVQVARTWRLIGTAACSILDSKLASDAYWHLPEADRPLLLRCCRSRSLDLVQGEFRHVD